MKKIFIQIYNNIYFKFHILILKIYIYKNTKVKNFKTYIKKKECTCQRNNTMKNDKPKAFSETQETSSRNSIKIKILIEQKL